MSRRVSLPGADELFRPTRGPAPQQTPPEQEAAVEVAPPTSPTGVDSEPRKPSGRVRHDEKITVYVTADELLDLEHTRLTLRRHHGLAADRGRLVRAAINLALEDVEANGADSAVVRRLREQ